jgi:hypothetical protein
MEWATMSSDVESAAELREFLKFTLKRMLRTIPVLFGVEKSGFASFQYSKGVFDRGLLVGSGIWSLIRTFVN